MKTPLFFIVALAAFFALPFDFAIMASLLFGAGLVAIVIGDYRRVYRPIGVRARVAVSTSERHPMAA